MGKQCAQIPKISTYLHDDLLSDPSSALSKSSPFFGHECFSLYLLKIIYFSPFVSVLDHGLGQLDPCQQAEKTSQKRDTVKLSGIL